mmetsp:Transcript_7338/g.9773  ORF Transcript_7338/g.9773 Transcript_7338/m.9773 type:complete len:183 (-) Transcript_7338:263-811(-)
MIHNMNSQDEWQNTPSSLPLIGSRENISESFSDYESAVAFLKEFHAFHVALHPSTGLSRIEEDEEESDTLSSFTYSNVAHNLHEENRCQIKHSASFLPHDAVTKNNNPQMRSLSSLATEEIGDDLKESMGERIEEQTKTHDYGQKTSELSSSWGFFTNHTHYDTGHDIWTHKSSFRLFCEFM